VWNVLPVDAEFESIAVNDIVVLGVLDDRVDLSDDTVDFAGGTPNNDNVLIIPTSPGFVLGADLDVDELIFTNEGIEDGSSLPNDEFMPFLVNVQSLSLDVGSLLGETFESGRCSTQSLAELGISSLLVGRKSFTSVDDQYFG
jgi:hypothetical protein